MFKWLKRLFGVQPDRTPTPEPSATPIRQSRSPYWDRRIESIYNRASPRDPSPSEETYGRELFARGWVTFNTPDVRESREEYLDFLDQFGMDLYDDFWADWREWYEETH